MLENKGFWANLIVAFIGNSDYNEDYNFRFYEWDGKEWFRNQ